MGSITPTSGFGLLLGYAVLEMAGREERQPPSEVGFYTCHGHKIQPKPKCLHCDLAHLWRSSQWSVDDQSGGRLLMLHADMILLKNFSTQGEFDEPNCSFEECPPQPSTADIVSQSVYSFYWSIDWLIYWSIDRSFIDWLSINLIYTPL